MSTITRRKCPRYSDHAPILYAGNNSQNYSKAMMHNSCFDGMYFESDSSIQLESDLFIKLQRHLKRSLEPFSYMNFRARVKWCRQMPGGKRAYYGIGVNFIAKSHLAYGTNIENSDYLCDFCETRISGRLIHRTETGLFLCPACLNYMETLPCHLEKNLERTLLGNVV